MKDGARVHSTEALEQLLARLSVLSEDLTGAVLAAKASANRSLYHIQVERRAHWQRQFDLATKELKEAKAALARAELQKQSGKPSVVIEQRAVESAKRALKHADDKLHLISKWSAEIATAADQFHSGVAPLRTFANARLDRASSDVKRSLDRLLDYFQVAAPPPASQSVAPDHHAQQSPGESPSLVSTPSPRSQLNLIRDRLASITWPSPEPTEPVPAPNLAAHLQEAFQRKAPQTTDDLPPLLALNEPDTAHPTFLARTKSGWLLASISSPPSDANRFTRLEPPSSIQSLMTLPIGSIVLINEHTPHAVFDRFDIPRRDVLSIGDTTP